MHDLDRGTLGAAPTEYAYHRWLRRIGYALDLGIVLPIAIVGGSLVLHGEYAGGLSVTAYAAALLYRLLVA